jgi:hypothetical protein
VTKHIPLLMGLLLWLPSLASADSADVATKLSNAQQKTPQVVKNIFYLGDSYLDDGNYQALTGFPLEYFSNEPPWSTDVNVALGFEAVGRWTTAGSPPNPLGNNYAVAGAGIGGVTAPIDTSFRGQVNLMLSDYPQGLPTNTLVVVAIGTNDVIYAVDLGGIWSTNLSGWRLNRSGFKVPAVGATVTVRVADTTGLVAGPNNLVIFAKGGGLSLLSVTAVDTLSSTVSFTNVSAKPGTMVSKNSSFEMAASYDLDFTVRIFTREINALLDDGASLVLALPPRTDILPLYNQGADQGLAYSTWLYLYTKIATAVSQKPFQNYDLNGFFDTVFVNFASYGFLYNYPGWDGNPNVSANEYVFWNITHPSGKTHQLIAGDFIQFLSQAGLAMSQ